MFAFWWGMRRVLPTVIQIQGGGLTLKYKVSFSGFAYVEADSPEEAEEKAMYEDDAVYEEKKCESVEEVDEFTVSLENCMERLTYWNEEYGCWSYHGPSGEAAKRLAAYEDTGLEPEEIGALKSREKGLVELLNGVSCGCAVTYTRLRELAQADRDGRCFVFRFGFGETVYRIWVHPSGEPAFVTENRMDTLNDLLNAETWDNAYKTRAEGRPHGSDS